MSIEFEYVTHRCYGRSVVFALNTAASDNYTAGLRKAPRLQVYLPYVLRRARQAMGYFSVVDIGANVGTVTLPLAANGVRVLAIEALPANLHVLSAAIRANRFRNVIPAGLAVFDAPGVVSLAGGSAWATIGRNGGKLTAPCDSLGNILETYGFTDADLIKIDIEGAELPALSQAEALFASRPDLEIIYESNNHTCHFFDYDRQDLMRWFEERGFRNYAFRADGALSPVRAADPQPSPVTDVLATKCDSAVLRQRGERVVPQTDEDVVRGLHKISGNRHPHIRKHFVTEVGRVSPRARALPLWRDIEKSLQAAGDTALTRPIGALASAVRE